MGMKLLYYVNVTTLLATDPPRSIQEHIYYIPFSVRDFSSFPEADVEAMHIVLGYNFMSSIAPLISEECYDSSEINEQ